MLDVTRERDPEVLRQVCFAYDKANRQLLGKVQELAARIADLEGLDAAQIGLDLPDVLLEVASSGSLQPTPTPEPPPRKPRLPQVGHGPTEQPDLPIETVEHRFDSAPDCTVCGRDMKAWPDQFEEAEEITVAERTYRIAIHRRQKYRCRCNARVVTAPGPPKLIPGGRYSIDFAAHSAIAKFCDHMPLERQVRQMAPCVRIVAASPCPPKPLAS